MILPFPPAAVLAAARIRPESVALLPWRHPLWRVVARGEAAVLHRYGGQRTPEDLAWEHAFLHRLTATSFPAPRPLPAFDGRSWTVLDGALWGLVSFLPGRALDWAPTPGLEAVGAFLARYHEAVAAVTMPSPRPAALPLAAVREVAPWGRLAPALGGPAGEHRLRRHLDALPAELLGIGHEAVPRLIIHGDCTTSNVIVAGAPPVIVGLIDFAIAYEEAALADLGFGLWQSGRPEPGAVALDPARVARCVAGYAAVRRLGPAAAGAIALYLKARGLQLIVRWVRRGVADCTLTLARVDWLANHQQALADAIAAALT